MVRGLQPILFALLAASSTAYADLTLNLTQGVSPISQDIYELHMTIFWICVGIGVVVFGAMFYAIYKFRKSKGAKPADFHSHPGLEITWTIVPVIILVLMAIPATKVLLNMNRYEKEEVTIKITGYQWKWHYEYLEDGVSFFSSLSTPLAQLQNKAPKTAGYLRDVDHPLVLPIHKRIRFLITSNDVNHAWWVPDFGVKRDAVAGFINEAWTKIDKAGTYYGQCAELCGINHAFMPIVVVATTEQGYKDWIAKQKGEVTAGEADLLRSWTKDELMEHGKNIYNRACAACHQPNGEGVPPTFPALKGSKIATGPREAHLDIVFHGKSGTAMQAFSSQLSDVDIASVITYERNAWGNNSNSMLQPYQVKAVRDGKAINEALTMTAPPEAPAKKVTAKKAGAEQQTQVEEPVAATDEAVAEKKLPMSKEDQLKAAMMRGEKVYMTNCAVCHQPGGTGLPPTFPALKGSKVTTGPVKNHILEVMQGKKGTAMQAFMTQLGDEEVADVVTYERNAWGNNMGDRVTLETIKALRQQIRNKEGA